MLDPSSSSEDTGGDSDPEVVQELPRKPVGSSAGKRGPNNRAGGQQHRHQHRQQPGAPAGAPGKAAKHGGGGSGGGGSGATGEGEEEEEEEEEEERKERERIQKEEEERKIKLQIYVFVLRCISYPFNAKQPTDMARRQQKVNKQQLQAVKERFLAFLNGETQIVADEAFCNAVRSYYEGFLKSERVSRMVQSGGCSANDFRDVFKKNIERRVRSLPEIDGLSKETVLSSWIAKYDAIYRGDEDMRRQPQRAHLSAVSELILSKEQLYEMFQQILSIRKFEHQLLYNACQTVQLKSQTQQCPVSVCTQMTGIGCYVSCDNDKLVVPGNYTTAAEYHDRRLSAVICLQAYARRWLAKQAVQHLREERDRRLAWLELKERRRREEKEEQLRDRRQRWLNPQRREDFNLLYHALEKWRLEEEQRINSSLRGAERKAALCSLLEQETQLIAAIGCHRIAVHNNNYDKSVRRFLDKAAAPHRWRAADGRMIEMDSPHTIRARELRDIYNNITTNTASHEQRLEILMALKHTVKEHECQLTRDVVDLIDREVDLLTRGVKASSLEGLRKRISTLFLQFIKIPAFNPEVAKLLKVPQNPSHLKNDMFLCPSCHRYLRSADFSTSASARLSGPCLDCSRLDNIARSRNDFSCYKNILKRLRADEQRLNPHAKIPFLLQVEDVQYLVEVVWASRSALHAGSDLYNLVFVRWEHQRDWSPWNCFLLSKEETPAHEEVEDVRKTYEAAFIRRIEHMHTLARRHFSQIPIMAEYLDSAALGNQPISKPIAMATSRQTTDTPSASAR